MRIGSETYSLLDPSTLGRDTEVPGRSQAGQPPGIPGARDDQALAGSPAKGKPADSLEISDEAKREVAKLKATDQRVRAHEAAHMAAAGGLAKGGAQFTYTRGPDGKLYAVAGEVSMDTSAVSNNPEATLEKARRIKAAALAPSDPSAQDRSVAAAADNMAVKASAQMARERMQDIGGPGDAKGADQAQGTAVRKTGSQGSVRAYASSAALLGELDLMA